MASKKETYKWVKIAGILSFIPFILAGGLFGGYLAGDFISNKFPGATFALPLCIGIGLAAAVMETIRAVRLTLKIDKKA